MNNNKKLIKTLLGSSIFFIILFAIGFSKDKTTNNEIETNQEGNISIEEANTEVKDTQIVPESYVTNKIIQDDKELMTEEISEEINQVIYSYYDVSENLKESLFTFNNKEEKTRVMDVIHEKRENIEGYSDIQTYIRDGLSNETYTVFVSYNTKISNIDTLVPGMTVLYVVNEDGKYKIKDESQNEIFKQMVAELSKEEEIAKEIEAVNSRLSEAVEKDKILHSFLQKLNDTL